MCLLSVTHLEHSGATPKAAAMRSRTRAVLFDVDGNKAYNPPNQSTN
jgi:hypothetical protein